MNLGKAFGASRAVIARTAAMAVLVAVPGAAFADEGGTSYWVPGSFGSMAAVPTASGWSVTGWLYYANTQQKASAIFVRDPVLGAPPANVAAIPSARQYNSTYQDYIVPTYTFKDPVLGGQLALGVTAQVGPAFTTVSGVWSGYSSTPSGAQRYTEYRTAGDTIAGLGDLAPQASLKWAFGVHNFLAYAGFNIPVGQFSATRYANIGIGHWAIDAGGGYTYFDQKSGWEFSGVLGFTYSFINPSTQYQDGVDMHFDWAASYTINDKLSVGVVGYAFKQLTCDGGRGDFDACDISQIVGAGPQLTYNFPVNDWQGSLNFKVYREFFAQSRPAGWNGWITLSISPPSQS
ncbi:transporter [Rhodoblastus sp. 17X3]|uniref:SphA family protein n=1 Tax=Rhodoblastus sp. 17X3 TaxID=3047026 RepID=UPI0024B80442|nr:transporter [Rhodoblastus sp. 17X3]MDI9849735.1 transporter [Rhodoblastus sp. 17X3]